MTRQKATAIGFTAILMWALLALMTIGSAPVPPFLLNALCFGIGGAIGLVWVGFGAGFGVLRQISWKVYAFGTIGLFGYHALYFTAFRIAPFAETGLIAYLWPLFIVLFSGLLPGERLRPLHVIGGHHGGPGNENAPVWGRQASFTFSHVRGPSCPFGPHGTRFTVRKRVYRELANRACDC